MYGDPFLNYVKVAGTSHFCSKTLLEIKFQLKLQPVSTHKPLKRQIKIAADDILIFYFYLSKKIKLDVSLETASLIFSEKQ